MPQEPAERLEYICFNHVHDNTLRRRLEDGLANDVECDICGSVPVCGIEGIYEIIHSAIGAKYKPAKEWNDDWGEIERGEATTVYDIAELLDEIWLSDAVDRSVYNAVECSFGDDTMWVTTFETDLRPAERDRLGWSDFCDAIKHRSRFMLLDEQAWVSHMYGVLPPSETLRRVAGLIGRHGLFRIVDRSTDIWRGRVDADPHPDWGFSDLASAPPEFARQSRMSAAGISMFYGAFELDTVAAELADDNGAWLTSGRFRPVRPLVLVDLTEVPDYPSPFAENAAQDDDELTFLSIFTREVSKPVSRPDLVHVDYTPTQAATEYLRFAEGGLATGRPVDGIVYRSSRRDTECVALFADHSQCVASQPKRSAAAASGPLLHWAGKQTKVRRHRT